MRKIKICYLSESAGDWGGASRVLFTNLKNLDKERFEPWVLLPKEGPIVNDLDRWGVNYHFWGKLTEPVDYGFYLKNCFRFALFLRKHRFEIVHSNHIYWRSAEILAAKLMKVPIVTHYHVVVRKAGPFVKLSRLIIANSNYTARASKPDQVSKKVIYNPIELDRFDRGHPIRRELGVEEDDTVVSFIGQIKKIKGVDSFIRMAKELSLRKPGTKFLIVGECRRGQGDYTEQALLAEIGGHPDILYLGRREDVENIYHSSDILVMPSRWDEPFGLINIEAGACRKPIVSTRVGGIPEIIEHGRNGFLVERADMHALLDRVMQLIDDPDLRRRMGQTGREKVEREFTTKPVRELEQTYLELLAHG
ncbi:glycosyltransferase family 4 protein [Methylohalobius crimeensis]|uniref:glycosyltransferase family 4 protein n=1 Tax=Methylohalobius crimeensis TaxID=244365 RepID=UPI0003B2E4CD|nr:glycosyltransferase family 4 protein [Methylohalobius crimeensis]